MIIRSRWVSQGGLHYRVWFKLYDDQRQIAVTFNVFVRENGMLVEIQPGSLDTHSIINLNSWDFGKHSCDHMNNLPCYCDGRSMYVNLNIDWLAKGDDVIWAIVEKEMTYAQDTYDNIWKQAREKGAFAHQ